jgi:hypothetical protein
MRRGENRSGRAAERDSDAAATADAFRDLRAIANPRSRIRDLR